MNSNNNIITLQNISFSNKDLNILLDTYCNNSNHELRQRTHTILMSRKGFGLQAIASALGRDNFEIKIFIKSFLYFGLDTLINDNFDDLVQKVKEREEANKNNKRNSISWVEIINRFLSKFNWLFKLINYLNPLVWIATILIFISKIPLPRESEYQQLEKVFKGTNNLRICGDKNNVTQVIINVNGKEDKIPINNVDDLITTLNKTVDTAVEFETNDSRITTILQLAKKYPKIKRIILYIGGYIVFYSIKGGIISKGGLSIATLLGYILIVAPLVKGENIQVQKSSNENKVIVYSDSIKTVINPLPNEDIYDFAKLPVSDEHDFLIGMSKESEALLKKDSVNHFLQNYYVNEKDDRAYLQIACYKDIRQAAVQRKHLIENHNFRDSDCKLLYIYNFGDDRYGVTIGNTERDNIKKLGEIQEEWNKKAKTAKVRAYIKTN